MEKRIYFYGIFQENSRFRGKNITLYLQSRHAKIDSVKEKKNCLFKSVLFTFFYMRRPSLSYLDRNLPVR